MRRVVLASANAHKLGELTAMFAAAGLEIEVKAARELGPAPTIVEDMDSFVDHAALKARGIAGWLAGRGEDGATLVLADDSGVCVDALDGRPGVHAAVFAGPEADDAANNARLLRELAERGLDRSPAHYVCVLALRRVDGVAMQLPGATASATASAMRHAAGEDLTLFVAQWHGEIRRERAGAGGFGYDPYFWIGETTAASLTPAEKNAQSHRGLAVRALVKGLAGLD